MKLEGHRPGYVVVLLVAIAVACMGCATNATPARKAYVSIADTVAAGTAAMQAFNERYQNGLQTEADRTKVLAGWEAFRAQVHFAEALAKDPNRVSDPVSLASDAVAQLLSLIATLKGTPQSGLYLPPWAYWPVVGR